MSGIRTMAFIALTCLTLACGRLEDIKVAHLQKPVQSESETESAVAIAVSQGSKIVYSIVSFGSLLKSPQLRQCVVQLASGKGCGAAVIAIVGGALVVKHDNTITPEGAVAWSESGSNAKAQAAQAPALPKEFEQARQKALVQANSSESKDSKGCFYADHYVFSARSPNEGLRGTTLYRVYAPLKAEAMALSKAFCQASNPQSLCTAYGSGASKEEALCRKRTPQISVIGSPDKTLRFH